MVKVLFFLRGGYTFINDSCMENKPAGFRKHPQVGLNCSLLPGIEHFSSCVLLTLLKNPASIFLFFFCKSWHLKLHVGVPEDFSNQTRVYSEQDQTGFLSVSSVMSFVDTSSTNSGAECRDETSSRKTPSRSVVHGGTRDGAAGAHADTCTSSASSTVFCRNLLP